MDVTVDGCTGLLSTSPLGVGPHNETENDNKKQKLLKRDAKQSQGEKIYDHKVTQ